MLFALYGFLAGVVLGIGVFAYFAKDLPDPEKFNERQVVQSTKIYDRTGTVILYDIHGEEKRTIIPTEEIPQIVKDATVVIEDDNFYHHFGVDLKGIARAFFTNLRGDEIRQGGSTITQQFIKNAVLTPERTYTRKIKEAILALELERKYSKEEILTFYLNQVPYGSNAYGVEAAAQTYFSKNARDLTLAEAALLAALPQATTYYSPYGSHTDDLKARQEHILDKMADFGYAQQEEVDAAKSQELKFSPQKHGLKAPHFVMFVQEYLESKYDSDYIQQAGLKVYTTLDLELQEMAEAVVAEGAANNEKYGASNAALVAIDPKSGQILTMVGSKDYYDIENDGNYNVATSPNRQPGSSFKPFAYATALKKGFTPETVLFDLKTSFGKHGPPGQQKEYMPNNYDNTFRGPLTLKDALAQSLNLPSVKTLYLAGLHDTIDTAQDMGITTLKDRSRYSLALVLGGGEVKLLDEVAAYGVFATEGLKHPVNFILKIEDTNGEIIEEHKDEPEQVLDAQIARQITDMISDNAARAPAFGLYSKLVLPNRPAAAKTGTTENYRDGWTVGFTPSLVAGVWAGNNDNTPMRRGPGASVAAPIWNSFMRQAYELKIPQENEELKDNEFVLPENVEYFTAPAPTPDGIKPVLRGQLAYDNMVKIDRISGKLATEYTPPELIIEKSFQEVHSILFYVDKNNPRGDYPENPEADEQFNNWEMPVLEWAKNPNCTTSTCPIFNQLPPTEYDDVHIPANRPTVNITSPDQGDRISDSTITIKASASAKLGVKQLDFFINDRLVGTDATKPYSVTVNLNSYLKKPYTSNTKQYIKVRAYDTVLNRQEDSLYIYKK